MRPAYKMIDGSYMYHVGKRLHTEVQCDGCGALYTDKPSDATVAIITDRSGSEQAATHNRWHCIQAAIENLGLDPYAYR